MTEEEHSRRASSALTEFPPDPTISVTEAARLLGVGRTCAYEAAARGQIPTVRIGRMLRVPKAALKRMLALDGKDSGADRSAEAGA
jgi:excisionase family DNA binding protein